MGLSYVASGIEKGPGTNGNYLRKLPSLRA